LRYLENPHLLDDGGSAAENGEALVTVVNTSFLYETAPMYVLDQPRFVNGACLVSREFLAIHTSRLTVSHIVTQIETTLAPYPLLELLKRIEAKVGRVPSIRNGPRAVDLDILIYDVDGEGVIDTRFGKEGYDGGLGTVKGDEVLTGELVIPHPRMQEREFVLRPLNE
jgi:dihydroneopterin aldolase/2-amino-4-hydroxy-6-hydroxymethyldihydropteridine diphosphokinase/dihydropteroate synthase